MPQLPGRLRSLDAFRGLAIAGMILVNNPGSWSHIYPPLEHAEWNGWTPTDLVFPFFLFIVGVSLTFSFARRRASGAGTGALAGKIAGRAAAIFLIGLLLNFLSRPDPSTVRIMGVLQRIALAYLAAALIYIYTSERTQRIVTAVLLVAYWALMTLVPVPGHGPGVLEPTGNLAQYIDSQLLRGHMWKADWDPEGILSTVPAIATCLIGTFAGRWLRSDREPHEKTAAMFVWGAGAIIAGLIWDAWFPINKNLWTSSYVLFTAGLALHVLAAMYWIIDVRGRARWAWPLEVFGSNALLVFVLSGLFARALSAWRFADDGTPTTAGRYAYEHLFASWAGPLNGSLAFAIVFVLVWLAIMSVFYRKRWFVRL
ncbi:MAG: heparan-alpha-glucosaminide N-acetyltransferase domain-containing protein [Gemmatimonadota bacterium]